MTDQKRNKGIYILPNLFTISGLFAGFFAIISAMKGHFDTAAIAVFVAMFADCLDGRVARLTNTESDFGAQFDSLSDLIAFGAAPSLVVFEWGLSSFGKLGWLAAFFYLAATALRLARFNVQDDNDHHFLGMPCPAAGGLLAGLVWFGDANGLHNFPMQLLALVMTVIAGALMVSSIRYYHFKHLDLKGKVPAIVVLGFLIGAFVVILAPARVLFLGFLLYAISGILGTLWFFRDKSSDYLDVADPEA